MKEHTVDCDTTTVCKDGHYNVHTHEARSARDDGDASNTELLQRKSVSKPTSSLSPQSLRFPNRYCGLSEHNGYHSLEEEFDKTTELGKDFEWIEVGSPSTSCAMHEPVMAMIGGIVIGILLLRTAIWDTLRSDIGAESMVWWITYMITENSGG